jgi:DnaJ-class molecular chaperone
MRQVFVSQEQIRQARTAWQQATGLCARCGGDGQVVTRIDSSGSLGHKPCDACGGTGRAVAP